MTSSTVFTTALLQQVELEVIVTMNKTDSFPLYCLYM